MKPYPCCETQSDLTPLPPLQNTPGYQVLEGAPQSAIRFDQGSATTRHRLGIWQCTPGTFRCIEKADELQTIVRGRLRLILEDGTSHTFGPGDSFYTQKGEQTTWQILQTVEKVFFSLEGETPTDPGSN